nr:uncharacterized protein LOC122269276 [Parasteatoda tepidariorum]
MVHPAHKTSHKYTNLPTSTSTSKTTTVQIYTDGSKTDNGVGAAFCVYHNNQHTDTYKFTLKQENTVFQAEVLAIKEAINWLETHSCKDATIFTDSLASIHAIRKTKQKDPHVATTQRQLEHLVRKCNTQIHWVAAHTGNIGNEAADLAAKDAAAGHGIPSGVLLPPSSLRNKLKNITQKLWQAYWDENEKGYTTKSYYPKVDTDRLIGHPAAIQFLTGHGFFPSFLHRMQRINTDTCPCDDTVDSSPNNEELSAEMGFSGALKITVYATPVDSEMYLVARIVCAVDDIQQNPGVFERVHQSMA